MFNIFNKAKNIPAIIECTKNNNGATKANRKSIGSVIPESEAVKTKGISVFFILFLFSAK